MEVDDEYEWMEEAGYKPVDGPLLGVVEDHHPL